LKVEVREVPTPQPRNHAAKIRMRYCGVCGTDIAIHAGSHPRAKPPLVIGHEFVGVIEEIRGGTRGFRPGDRVVAYPLLSCGVCLPCRTGTPHVCERLKLIGIDCDGGMADYAWVDEDVLFKVDDSLSDRIAALVEPLAVIVRSLHQSRYQVRDSAVVIGAGPIGLLTAIALQRSGASRIIISDIDEGRLGMCRALGYETVNGQNGGLIDFVHEATKGEGVDVVFECSGAESAAVEMTKLARIGGMICMTGIHKTSHPVDLREINFKEQTLVGSRVYTKREFEKTVAYASQLKDDLEQVVTQTVPLSKSERIFEMIADPSINTVKVLIDCAN
jgi:threonine dehydrogenase-like Zn-dependent dehydrogenase